MNKNFKSLLALALCVVMVACVFAGCKKDEVVDDTPVVSGNKQAEYNTFTQVMPSNWNELTYQDNNDTQIMSYIGSSFFEYDYKFENDVKYNADGSINKDGILKDQYSVNYSAATKLEDVTSTVDAKWGYTEEQKAEGGYAWKITLRDDLKWDDGTAITAADFVYSMQAQLDPAFMNYRGNTYYDTLKIKNSRGYFFQNQEGTYETVGGQGYASIADALAANETVYMDSQFFWGTNETYVDANGNPCPQWLSITDTTVYTGVYNGEPDPISGAALYANYAGYVEVGAAYAQYAAIYRENTIREMAWEDVGIYADGNAIVVCLDKSYELLNDDGTLGVWAAYYMSSLPLVHQAKYEAAKVAPADGATLWTSTYNNGLESTASWGPYKLAAFELGSHYRLEKNPNWYGWNMEQYKNQYNVTAINCEKVAEVTTQWTGFLAGEYDDAALDTHNIAEYMDSKYVSYAPGSGTYGMQLYSNLSKLKASDNNNTILAIQEFRHAFSLALNRTALVEEIWPGSAIPCLGFVNSMYYYDIENSAILDDSGIYRNTDEAKAALLRAYGFTEVDGKWSSGSLTNLTFDEAYEALSGYNPEVAKQKLVEAYNILVGNPETYGYDPSKKITLLYGTSVKNEKQEKRVAFLQGILDELSAGTPLEGQFEIVLDASAGNGWATAFRNGETQIGFGFGFTGNAFNPFNIAGAFVDPDDNLNYHTYWDTSAVNLTITLPAGQYDHSGKTYTMSAQNWFYCLNGLAADYNQPYTFNFSEGKVPVAARLRILAALEELTLKECRSIMLIGDYSGSLLSAKFSQFSSDYNTFMGFGGIRYMTVNYTDAEWTAFVAQNNGDLSAEYKKAE